IEMLIEQPDQRLLYRILGGDDDLGDVLFERGPGQALLELAGGKIGADSDKTTKHRRDRRDRGAGGATDHARHLQGRTTGHRPGNAAGGDADHQIANPRGDRGDDRVEQVEDRLSYLVLTLAFALLVLTGGMLRIARLARPLDLDLQHALAKAVNVFDLSV